mmetsp:Transcript_17628/g.37411  ORF Transcript_17628/g.37411 Transcript_17628/m.37411 type:complete len:300 (-) Transcript_17628:297-1196(-)
MLVSDSCYYVFSTKSESPLRRRLSSRGPYLSSRSMSSHGDAVAKLRITAFAVGLKLMTVLLPASQDTDERGLCKVPGALVDLRTKALTSRKRGSQSRVRTATSFMCSKASFWVRISFLRLSMRETKAARCASGTWDRALFTSKSSSSSCNFLSFTNSCASTLKLASTARSRSCASWALSSRCRKARRSWKAASAWALCRRISSPRASWSRVSCDRRAPALWARALRSSPRRARMRCCFRSAATKRSAARHWRSAKAAATSAMRCSMWASLAPRRFAARRCSASRTKPRSAMSRRRCPLK